MFKKVLAVVMAVSMVCCFAACGSTSTSTSTSSSAIKIGATGPLTGGASIYGKAVEAGAKIAVEEINAKGGIQFEFNMQDDAHDAEKAVNAYNDLKDWGMQLMMGTVTSAPAEATAAEAYNDRIFYLTPSASSTDVIKGKDNIFQMCFTDPNQGSASATYIYNNKMATKIGVIYKSDDNYSVGIYKTFVSKAAELGLTVAAEASFDDSSASDFNSQLSKMQQAGVDLVFLPIYYTPASLIFKQASQMGFETTWFGVDGMDGILTLEGFDTSLAEGVILLTPYTADDTSSLNQSFVKKYNEMMGEDPNQFAADAYDCIYALYEAVTKAGITADMTAKEMCDKMISAFTSMTFDGLTGTGMKWATDGTVSKNPNAMVIKNGAYQGL